MLILNRYTFLYALLFFTSNVWAQFLPENNSSLLFPINPGIPNTLAGTMGELRSSHFHTGIDIRTGGQEGLPVLAADDGYIFRVSVNPGGYGNSIYIRHPNGHSTVYGHLQSFSKEIAEYVRSQQYARQKFALNVFPSAEMFPVHRGDTIALSGNSGSSGGPHLHFDVRNRNQDLLNPLHYGFEEIRDNKAPLAKELALVTSGIDSRVANQFGRIVLPVSERNEYYVKDTIEAIGRIGLELFAYDRMDYTHFRTGINQINVEVNGKLQFTTTIDTWPFSKARQFYTYISYEALAKSGQRFHKLYVDDGNKLDFYSNLVDNGYLTIEEGNVYDVVITLADTYENESKVHFVIKGQNNEVSIPAKNTALPDSSWAIDKSVLMIESEPGDTCTLFVHGEMKQVEPAFQSEGNAVYLWDLKEGIADSFRINNNAHATNIKAFVPAGVEYNLYDHIADIQFKKKSLFSDIYLTMEHKTDSLTGMDIVTIGNPYETINGSFTINLKPFSMPQDKDHTRVYILYGSNPSFVGGDWKENYIQFDTRSYGTYTLLADSIPPKVQPLILNRDELVFKITDELSGIQSYNMYMNGEWVLMNYDPKKDLIWAEKPNSKYVYSGKLELKVTDNTNNETIYTTNLD
ncbi:MAG: M23 family metallopeptidase [Cyclobacteriaceae bacterium]|nr:M23 family metallopeptidase [Cyclobacteriaceae bacterium]